MELTIPKAWTSSENGLSGPENTDDFQARKRTGLLQREC